MEAPHKENSTWSNGTATTTNPPNAGLDEANENDWTRVDYRNNGRKSWIQKANCLRSTAKCEFERLSAAIPLVVYGLAKHVTSLQLSRYIESKDILDLLTKYEGARSLSFKITIRSCDYDKVINSDIWPVGVRIRRFKFLPRKGSDGKNINNYNQYLKSK